MNWQKVLRAWFLEKSGPDTLLIPDAIIQKHAEIVKQLTAALPVVETQPIIAYRAWNCPGDLLDPVNNQYTPAWNPLKPAAAICVAVDISFGIGLGYRQKSGVPGAPHADCGCGYYGFKTPDDLAQVAHADIFGRVALWGKVFEHKDGYRAEFAYPQVLYTHRALRPDLIARVAAKYGVDVVPAPPEMLAMLDEKLAKHYATSWARAISHAKDPRRASTPDLAAVVKQAVQEAEYAKKS